MILSELKRFEQLSKRDNLKTKIASGMGEYLNDLMPLTFEEEEELRILRGTIIENAGSESDSAGFVVVSNYKWIYRVYEDVVDRGGIERSEQLERRIFWSVVELIEKFIHENGTKNLLLGDVNYYRVLSFYLNSDQLLDHVKGSDNWRKEIIAGKWGILRRRIKEDVRRLIETYRVEDSDIGLSVEDRVEPIFNKILKQINKEIDADNLTQGEKLKIFDKLSGLLADVKGERKQETGVQVTHNNVFALIMQEKGDRQLLQGKASEILEGEGYLLE